ncbi:3-dehydroquinate synthase-like protein [Gossypium australe]|uniref:3-dehydroquinate synthase-like protein n=1 Tax=Gossypium australe TaxID=47621 RepID=A0A5B6UMR4_9ROSI|nr:3-dehydroquinate synthase-like protein [Gossypium australe]
MNEQDDVDAIQLIAFTKKFLKSAISSSPSFCILPSIRVAHIIFLSSSLTTRERPFFQKQI